MKDYKKLMNEVYSFGDTGKKDKFGLQNHLGRKITPEHTHIGNIGDHKVYHKKTGYKNEESYSVADHEGKVTNVLTVRKHPHHIKVDVSATNGKGPKQHELYHHLITKHDKVITTNAQTTGGHHIWKKLAKKGSVNIHGWDPKEKKAVNIDHRLRDEDETHHNRTRARGITHITNMHLVAHKK